MRASGLKAMLLAVVVAAVSIPGMGYAAAVTGANAPASEHHRGDGEIITNRRLRFNNDGSHTWITEYVDSYMAGRVLEETTYLDGSKKQEMIYPDGSRGACRINEDGSVTETVSRVRYEDGVKRSVTGEKTTYPDGTVKTRAGWGSQHGKLYLYTDMEITEAPDGSAATVVRLKDKDGNLYWTLSEERDASGFATVTSDGGGAAMTFQGTYPVLKQVGGDTPSEPIREITVGERTWQVVS